MLTKLTFMAGSTPQKDPLEIHLSPVTIFVGPNNSGKSRALIEIEAAVKGGSPSEGVVTKSLELEAWTKQAFAEEFSEITIAPRLGEQVNQDYILISKLSPQQNTATRMQLHVPSMLNEACNPNGDSRHHYAQYLSLFTLRLDGRNRLALTNDQPAGDLQETTSQPFSSIVCRQQGSRGTEAHCL